MSQRPILAYLTSAYARASDTFIRGEVRQLRAMGFTVHTFSIRRSEPEQMVSDDVRQEQANTDYILEGSKLRLLKAAAKRLVKTPGRFMAALSLAQRCSPPGLKARVWHLAYVIEAAYLAEQLEARGVRHLHNHIGENSAAVAMLASLLSGIPYSLTIHGPNEFDQPIQLALGQKVRRSAFTATISSFSKSQLCRWCDLEQWKKIHVVHCGVDDEFLSHPATPAPAAPRLVSIGRLSEQKGQLVLVEAAALLAALGVEFELVLVGDGPMRPQLEKAIRENGLTGKVRLAGWMDSAGVRRELLESRALVMPSFAEGLPVVIMEALALSRPVLSTSIAGIPELVRDRRNGWLVPAGSAQKLSETMREILALTSDELAEIGRRGMQDVAREHNQSTEAAKLAGLFEASAAPRRQQNAGIATSLTV
ncbi:MAG TPA: glycosyltransferase [Tepidisphaeraceae bacterium]|nr:glycosyltransferase [Tepidisphaeraceae bacterium]